LCRRAWGGGEAAGDGQGVVGTNVEEVARTQESSVFALPAHHPRATERAHSKPRAATAREREPPTSTSWRCMAGGGLDKKPTPAKAARQSSTPLSSPLPPIERRRGRPPSPSTATPRDRRARHAVGRGRRAGEVVAVVQQGIRDVLFPLVVFAVRVLAPPAGEGGGRRRAANAARLPGAAAPRPGRGARPPRPSTRATTPPTPLSPPLTG